MGGGSGPRVRTRKTSLLRDTPGQVTYEPATVDLGVKNDTSDPRQDEGFIDVPSVGGLGVDRILVLTTALQQRETEYSKTPSLLSNTSWMAHGPRTPLDERPSRGGSTSTLGGSLVDSGCRGQSDDSSTPSKFRSRETVGEVTMGRTDSCEWESTPRPSWVSDRPTSGREGLGPTSEGHRTTGRRPPVSLVS